MFIIGLCSRTGFNPILIMIFTGSETYLFAIRGAVNITQQVCAINLDTFVLQLVECFLMWMAVTVPCATRNHSICWIYRIQKSL